MNKQMTHILKLVAILAFVASCTKTRQAELPEDAKSDVFAISEFGATSDQTAFAANLQSAAITSQASKSFKILDTVSSATISTEDVTVPERLKFMFEALPISGKTSGSVKITFAVDKDYVTAYKVVSNVDELSPLEKSIAISVKEAQLVGQVAKAASTDVKGLILSQKQAASERSEIKMGSKKSSLLVPMFKYKIDSYGVLERNKNDLKESTSVLGLKKTDFRNATHVKITSGADSRLLVGLTADQKKQMDQLFAESKIDNQVTTAEELENNLNIGLKFLDPKAKVLTRLDADVMHVYQIQKAADLTPDKLRLFKNKAGNKEVMACSDESISKFIGSSDKDCVVVLKADIPVSYKASSLALVDVQGNTSNAIQFENVPRSKSVGLVEILSNTAAKQVDITGVLDPDSSIRVADLKGEFFYRRTFEEASNMYLGYTGTSGDMSIVRFELEDKRLVVRNQQSLITYTGQGPKDREEIMSFPVKYITMQTVSANGAKLAIPVAEASSKERAEYVIIDWTQNTVPNASSPLSFYDGGNCFLATSSQRVANTDMRLATDGVLNFSLAGSYTMKPEIGCMTIKDVNAMYWAGMVQFNFNIAERISFKRRVNLDSDQQISMNISGKAQEAFNFGVFTLADKVTTNGALNNHDGSEKYLPMIHDFRNGKKVKYFVGGLNNAAATSPERRQILIEATQQVVKEWNSTLRYAFRGTTLERAGDYIEMQVDEGENTGHLGDLDRNYIWYQELQAENGLLGVAQPAANPRSGTIESSNVIIYSGNSFAQAEYQIAATKVARQYEKEVERVRAKAFAEAKQKIEDDAKAEKESAKATVVTANKNGADSATVARLQKGTKDAATYLKKANASLGLNNKNIRALVNGTVLKRVAINKIKNKEAATNESVNTQISKYEVNKITFVKKLTDMVTSKTFSKNPHALELAVTTMFRQHADLDDASKAALDQRALSLTLAARFDENNKNRPGCFEYQRSEINDQALNLDPDEHKNLMLNFKKTIMSTLSHELGHAFGLLHNFQASMDKANYEFPEDKNKPTGRNYSSIMDYMSDIEQHYAGPGPYDAHALRAAYTGYVELPEDTKGNDLVLKAKIVNKNLISIKDVMTASGSRSLVHFSKDTLNKTGLIKYYQQCSDGGLWTHATCAQFDLGGSATEVVQNSIRDYNRGYLARYYSGDKINFGWTEKIHNLYWNLYLYGNIFNYLGEAMAANADLALPSAKAKVVKADLLNAAKLGYQFFHEVIRTPERQVNANDFEKRFEGFEYTYVGDKETDSGDVKCKKDAEGSIICRDIKVLEYKAVHNIAKNSDKIDTQGIDFDKYFAMNFLLSPTYVRSNDDTGISWSSYFDFEQTILGVSNVADSLTVQTLQQILSNELSTGFFKPTANIKDVQLLELKGLVASTRMMKSEAAFASIYSLAQTKWAGYDPTADAFKISRSSENAAPKDRMSVAKQGHERGKGDTRVFFASQNSTASESLIKKAARNDYYLTYADNMQIRLAKIFVADRAYRKIINAKFTAACSADKNGNINETACGDAGLKTPADFAKENPTIAKLIATANAEAAATVAYLRDLNKDGALMDKDLDLESSPNNFARQVETARNQMISQLKVVADFLKSVENSPKENAEKLLATIEEQQSDLSVANLTYAEQQLGWVTLNLIKKTAAAMEQKTSDGQKIDGTMVTDKLITNSDALAAEQQELLLTIEDMANYSSWIDPDTNSNR